MISVCLATYNGERYLREQLFSILPQLSAVDEVIISDDGSIDATLRIAASFEDSRIKIFRNGGRSGVMGNFENALHHSIGNIIFLCDQDDVWHSDKVAVMTEALRSHTLAVCDARVIDGEGRVIADSFFAIRHSGSGFFKNLLKNGFLGCCMAFRRELLAEALPFPRRIAMHDIWLGLCAELFGDTVFIHRQLTDYRRHGNNVSPTDVGGSNYSTFYRISYRARMYFELVKRFIVTSLR